MLPLLLFANGGRVDFKKAILSEELQIKKLDELVQESIKEEQLLTSKLLELESDEHLSPSQKLADRVADFGGSWAFISFFLVAMIGWIGMNVYWFDNKGFDPYPFILLNLILSCIAALQAPIIMMSQNRQDEKDRRRSRADYMVNLKSELEIRGLHSKLDLLIAEEMKTLFKIQQSQMELLLKIQAQLNTKPPLE